MNVYLLNFNITIHKIQIRWVAERAHFVYSYGMRAPLNVEQQCRRLDLWYSRVFQPLQMLAAISLDAHCSCKVNHYFIIMILTTINMHSVTFL